MNTFETLNAINVNEHTEQKGRLTYLSWCWAWGEVKKRFPDAQYTIYEAENGCIYHTDGKTAWVKTGVTINGLEHIEYLPVMDNRNKSIPIENITSFDANTAIQRSITKAIARHGLGLYIYAGEDLPEAERPQTKPVEQPSNDDFSAVVNSEIRCDKCGKVIEDVKTSKQTITAAAFADKTKAEYGKELCLECAAKAKAAKNAGQA